MVTEPNQPPALCVVCLSQVTLRQPPGSGHSGGQVRAAVEGLPFPSATLAAP